MYGGCGLPMITDVVVAKRVSELMLECSGLLNESVRVVMEHESEEELQRYRVAVGTVMAELALQILNPLYEAHSTLKPPRWYP